MRKKPPDFIKEKYSPVFNRLFYWYSVTLFLRRFKCVWLDDSGHPPAGNSTLFIGNHNSWWDALIPFLLNERVYKMVGRAIMDEHQLEKYPFFRRIGTFSINREFPRKAMKSLEYAADLMNGARPGAGVGLWFYPEGKLVSPDTPVTLESGLAWLARRLNPRNCDMVPFAVHMHTMRSDKPELFIKMGNATGPSMLTSTDLLMRTTRILEEVRRACRQQSSDYNESRQFNNGFRLILGKSP